MKSKSEVMRDLSKVRRRKIIIQQKESYENHVGDIVTNWTNWKTCWAERSNLWGADYYAAQAVNEEESVIFTVPYVRFLDDLNSVTHRIWCDGKPYDIKQIDRLQDGGPWVKIKALGRD